MTDPTHYHVSRHAEDDDVFVTPDIFTALDYAATELSELADMEHSMVSYIAGKVTETPGYMFRREGDQSVSDWEMEDALRSFAKAERYSNLQANAENMVRQNDKQGDDRAPLYRDDDATLLASARRAMEQINSDSPLSIWECAQGTYTDEEEIPRCEADRW